MEAAEKTKIPDVLCPFYERECLLGEATARLCWQRWDSPDEASVDFNQFEVDCTIARWMFSPGYERP